MTSESQSHQILTHLRKGKSITPIEALREYGCFRLGARIYDLKREGYTIQKEMVEARGKRFAKYSMRGKAA